VVSLVGGGPGGKKGTRLAAATLHVVSRNAPIGWANSPRGAGGGVELPGITCMINDLA
jgi:hypothetical protein